MDVLKKRSVAFSIAIVTVLLSTWHLFRTYSDAEEALDVASETQITEETEIETEVLAETEEPVVEEIPEVHLSDLVGTWGLQGDSQTLMTFQEDGTIFFAFGNEVREFEWEIFAIAFPRIRLEDTNLVITFEDGTEEVYIRQSYEPQNLAVGNDILHDIPFLNNLIERTLALEFEEIVLMIDERLEGAEVSEDDVAYEIHERATRAIALMDQVDVVIDDFDAQVTVYYAGIREINASVHVVPYIQIGRHTTGHNRPHRAFSAANFYLLTGIRHGSEFGFTRTELRMSDDRIIWRNHNLDGRNELSIVPIDGAINEIATRSFSLGLGGTHRSGYPRRFEWDMDVNYNHMLRFVNQDTNANHDVILSEREISAVATIAELFNIMSELAVHIPEREF